MVGGPRQQRQEAPSDQQASRHVLVIVGPTASGKSAVAMLLAEALGCEIISADSRQVFKYLDIGTAKPSIDDRRRIVHHFIDVLTPDCDFSAGEFGEQGRRTVDQIFARSRRPLVVGGSGLYVKSLIDGFFSGPGADPEYREFLERRLVREGIKALREDLRRVDPASAGRIDPTKPRRIIRALEVYHTTGIPLSQAQSDSPIAINFRPILFGLDWERKLIYDRINRRCEQMVESGLVREVRGLERRGYTSALNSLNTVGYKEAFALLRGECTTVEMLERFKQNSRRYAKRQLTWFRRDRRIRWIPMKGDDAERIASKVIGREFSRLALQN